MDGGRPPPRQSLNPIAALTRQRSRHPRGPLGVDSFTSPRWDEDKERTSSRLWATGQVGRNGRNAHRVIASDTPSCRTRSRILPTFRSFPRCCRYVESYGGEVNSRGPRYDSCINDQHQRSTRGFGVGQSRRRTSPRPWGTSTVDALPRLRNPADSRLGVEPLTVPHQLCPTRGVSSVGPIGDGTASSTHRHPSVGLREMVLVESSPELPLFG